MLHGHKLIKTYDTTYTRDTSVATRMTTVKVRPDTKKMLAELGRKEDTYDEIIVRLLEFYKKNSKGRI